MYGDETKVTLSEGSPSGLSLRPRESAQLRNKSLPRKYTSLSITLQIIPFISDKYHTTDLLGYPPLPPSYPAKVGAGLPMPPPSWERP